MTRDVIEIQDRIEGFIRSHFMVSDDDARFDRSSELFENGYVDSVGVVELLSFIADEFSVDIPEEMLLSEEFSTVGGIGRIVGRLK